MISNNEVDTRNKSFDEWLETQGDEVKEKVRSHIAALTNGLPNIGEKSAKVLLSEVYLRVRKVTRLQAPEGAIPPILVLVEDVK
jgi:hypothetical protein